MGGLVLGMPLAISAAESIAGVEKAAVEWARVRTETVQLETDWKSRRELLEGSVAALQERLRFLESKRDAVLAKTASDRDARASLKTRTEATEQSLRSVVDQLNQISTGLLQLRPMLPPRLSQALELPGRSLADPSLSPGDRVQLIVKVLNRCAQFNKSIVFAEEAIATESDGSTRVLEVLYWGLSHGYALDRANGKTYYGHPGERAWVWDPLPEQAERVSKLIAIYHDKADPVFVEASAQASGSPTAKP